MEERSFARKLGIMLGRLSPIRQFFVVLLTIGVVVLSVSLLTNPELRSLGSGDQTATAAAQSPSSRCSDASRTLLNEIGSLLTVSGGGSLRDGKTVRSDDFERVWFVAAEIDGPGLDQRGDIGIWASNEPDGSELILSVDAVAREFSDWFYGPSTDFNVNQFDHGAQEAKDCQESR